DEGARDRDPLPFAAAQLAGAVLGAIEEANLVEQIAGLRLSVRRCRQRRGQLDVLPCGEQVEEAEMLKDESDRGSPIGGQLIDPQRSQVVLADRQGSRLRAFQATDQREQCALARAGRSGQRHVTARRDLELDVVKRLDSRAPGSIPMSDAMKVNRGTEPGDRVAMGEVAT